MASKKLSTNLVTRVSEDFKKEVESLAASYEIGPADLVRRCLNYALRKWTVPGLSKRPKP